MLVLNLGVRERIDFLAFAPDGRALAAAGPFGVRFWREISDGALAQAVSEDPLLLRLCFARDGQSLFFCSSNVWRADISTGVVVPLEKEDRYPLFDVSPDGRFILIANDVPTTTTTNVLTCQRVDDLTPSGIVWKRKTPGASSYPPHYLADGTRFVRLEGGWSVESGRTELHAITYDAATGKPVAESPTITAPILRTAVAPDGRWLVGRREAWLYYRPIATEVGPAGDIKNDSKKHFTDAAFHPSGKYLAVTSNDTTVKLFDTTTWGVARTFSWKIKKLCSVAFSSDGTLAAAGNDQGKVIVWDVDL